MTSTPDKKYQIWVVTDASHAGAVKNILEHDSTLERSLKIINDPPSIRDGFIYQGSPKLPARPCAIPTTLFEDDFHGHNNAKEHLSSLLGTNGVTEQQPHALIVARDPSAPPPPSSRRRHLTAGHSELADIVRQWLSSLPPSVRSALPCSAGELVACSTWSYTKYPPMVVLQGGAFKTPPWQALLRSLPDGRRLDLYRSICAGLDVTHVALNAPIPLLSPADPGAENSLRAPADFRPVWGDFGPPEEEASAEGHARAFWVSARQNGVVQVFAPRYTMFSRGNISEKRRVMEMADLSGPRPGGRTAVDLYAGVGYFAFSYARARVEHTLCWEINRWSVEGFRRGAVANKWSVRVVEEGEALGEGGEVDSALDCRLVMFNESNEKALARIDRIRHLLPPITHANCGFLPSSREIWRDAVHILDPEEGGCVHAHENVAAGEIQHRAAELEALFDSFANEEHSSPYQRHVKCIAAERVKTYAPGVYHCVFDMQIDPVPKRTPAAESDSKGAW